MGMFFCMANRGRVRGIYSFTCPIAMANGVFVSRASKHCSLGMFCHPLWASVRELEGFTCTIIQDCFYLGGIGVSGVLFLLEKLEGENKLPQ